MIDYILVSQNVKGTARVVSEYLDGMTGCDHRPLLADFRWDDTVIQSPQRRVSLRGWAPQNADGLQQFQSQSLQILGNSLGRLESDILKLAQSIEHTTAALRGRDAREAEGTLQQTSPSEALPPPPDTWIGTKEGDAASNPFCHRR